MIIRIQDGKILTSLAPQIIGVPLPPAPVTLKVSKTNMFNTNYEA